MGKLGDALAYFDTHRVKARMYRQDVDLGTIILYEPGGVMTVKVSDPEPIREVRFSPKVTEIREEDHYQKISPEDFGLELFRLLDPRIFKGILGRAQEIFNWPGQFQISFNLWEVITGFRPIVEEGIPSEYSTKAYGKDIPRAIPLEVREWVADLVGQPRQVIFYIADYLDETRLVEMVQADLPPENEPFSLRFSYD